MKKKLLSLALCLCMVLSLLPSVALAATEQGTVGSIEAGLGIEGLAKDDTFKVGNVTYTYGGDRSDKELDLFNKSAINYLAPPTVKTVYKADSDGSTDGKVGYILWDGNKTMTLNNAQVTVTGGQNHYCALGLPNGAVIELPAGTSSSIDATDVQGISGSDVTISGEGNLTVTASGKYMSALNVGGTTSITAGQLSLTSTNHSAINLGGTCTLNVPTVTLTTGAADTGAIQGGSDGKLTIAANSNVSVLFTGDSKYAYKFSAIENNGTLTLPEGAKGMKTHPTDLTNVTDGITGTGTVVVGDTPYINAGGTWKACTADEVAAGKVTIDGVTYIKFNGAWVKEGDTVTIGDKTYTYKGDVTEAGASFYTVGVGGDCKPLEGNLVWKAGNGYILYSYNGTGSAAVTLHSASASAKGISLPYTRGDGATATSTGCDTTVTLEGISTLSGCLNHEAGGTTFTGNGTLSLTKYAACSFKGPVIIENGANVTLGNGSEDGIGSFYNTLTVKSGGALIVAAKATLYSESTVENGGTLENNGIIQMKNKTAANPGISGEITGTGVVHFGSDTTPYIKVNGEWLASGGDKSSAALDLTTAPAVKTLYTAGTNGTILWEPTTNGGTLTFNNATMNVVNNDGSATAVTLPDLTDGINVVFKGENSITANAISNVYAFKCSCDTTFELKNGTTTLTANGQYSYGISSSGSVTVNNSGAFSINSSVGGMDFTIFASGQAVTLNGGTMAFKGDAGIAAGTITLSGITVPAGKSLSMNESGSAAIIKYEADSTINGELIMPFQRAYTASDFTHFTGSGTVKVGDTTYKMFGSEWVAYGGDVPDNGLDLSVLPPTVKTVYTADTGTIIWEPTLDDNSVVSSGKLTLNNAKINLMPIASTAIKLPDGVPVTVELLGTSTITSSAQQPGYAVFEGTGDVTLTGSGSINAKTSGYFIKTDGAVTLKGGTPYGRIYAPAGATLDGVTFQTLDLREVSDEISATGAVNNGTLQLPATTTAEEIKALGLTGTGLVMVEEGTAPVIKTHYYRNDGTVFPYRTEALDFTAATPEAGHYKTDATVETDGYSFTGDAAKGYVLTLGDLMITSNDSIAPAINLPTDGKVEVKLTGNTRVSTGGYGMKFGSAGTISGSGSLTLNCQGVALISSQPLTISGGNITATNSAGYGVDAANLTISGGTLTVSGSSAAFGAVPTFTGYTPKVTYGDSALSTTTATSPGTDTYTTKKYVKIEKYVAPSGSTEPEAPAVETPKTEGGATTVTANIEPTISGKTATATVPADTVTEAAKAATEAAKESGTKPVVELKIETPAGATQVKTELPTEAIKTVAESGATLTVATGVGAVELNSEVLASVAEKANGKTLTLTVEIVDPKNLTGEQQGALGDAENTVVVDLTLSAGDEKISELGGTVSVSIPYSPAEGEKTETLKVWFIADDGTITPCDGTYDAKTKSYVFKTNHFSAYVLAQFPFEDVSESAWYYGNAVYAYLNGLFAGTSDTTFAPETAMSRAMLVTVLWRMENSPEAASAGFSDVAAGAWYEKAVNWAADKKIVEGSDGKFMPDDAITREQLATIIFRYAAFKGIAASGENAEMTGFSDVASVSDYALESMGWAVKSGLVNGSDGALMPQGSATRAQVAAILQRFCNAFVK